MLDSLIHLPYVHYWLPAAVAVVFGVPVYWFALRPSGHLAPAPAGPTGPPEDRDPFTAGSTTEQRKAFRRKGNPVEILFTPEEAGANPDRGYVLDRSIGGLRLMVTRAVPPGTTLSVRPANVSPMIPWIQIEIRNCTPSTTQAGEYDIGCRFVKAPPYPVLLLFG